MLIDKIVLEVVGITSNLVLSRFNYLSLRGDDDGGSSAPSMVCRHNQQDDLYRFIVAATDDSPDHLMSLYNRPACQSSHNNTGDIRPGLLYHLPVLITIHNGVFSNKIPLRLLDSRFPGSPTII